jgi:hypothetical protein
VLAAFGKSSLSVLSFFVDLVVVVLVVVLVVVAETWVAVAAQRSGP